MPKTVAVWLLKQLLPGHRAQQGPNNPNMGTVLSFSPRSVGQKHKSFLFFLSWFISSFCYMLFAVVCFTKKKTPNNSMSLVYPWVFYVL